MAHAYSSNSDSHRMLLEFISKVTGSSPSVQQARKLAGKQTGESLVHTVWQLSTNCD